MQNASQFHDEPNNEGAERNRGDLADALARSNDRQFRRGALLDALITAGVIGASQAASVLSAVEKTNEPLDRALSASAIPEEQTVATWSEVLGWPRLASTDDIDLSGAVDLSTAFLLRERILPFRGPDDALCVAVADPANLTGVRGCAYALRASLRPVLATSTQIERLLLRLQPDEIDANTSVADIVGDEAERLRDLASGEPAVRLCMRLIGEAHLARASDIHIEADERRYRVRFRIDGVLRERQDLAVRQGLAVISRVKILSNLDIAERRRPQDGRFSFSVSGRPIDLRVSTAPSQHGEDIVLRLLQRDAVQLDLDALGFSADAAARLHALSDRPNGILLLTGPTGSGKTTTLYALLRRLATSERKILTIEDPVEYRIAGVSQTQINPAIGLDFAKGLRSFLRHDPDIIMVGEMRDLETARTAVQAALTGHLVLSTLHTNDAPSAVTRLLDMGIDDYLVASTLIGVVGQRLVRKICASCGGRPRDANVAPCAACEGVGFFGRLAVAEVLEIDERLKPLIKSGVSSSELLARATELGFSTMTEDGARKVAAGLTTRAELERAIVM